MEAAAKVALVAEAGPPTLTATHILVLGTVGSCLGIVVEDGADGVIILAVIHGEIQYLIGVCEH